MAQIITYAEIKTKVVDADTARSAENMFLSSNVKELTNDRGVIKILDIKELRKDK